MTMFVKVNALKDLFASDDFDNARWQENLRKTGIDGDLDVSLVDEDGDYVYGKFHETELEYMAAGVFYNFMGEGGGDERFYPADFAVYRDAGGKLWVENRDDLFEF